MHTSCKLHSVTQSNTYAYSHTSVLSFPIRQGTLNGVRSKVSNRQTSGTHIRQTQTQAVSAKEDDRTRQSHKGRLKSTYTNAVRQRSKYDK